MLSLISTQTRIPNYHYHFSRLKTPPITCLVVECNPKKRTQNYKKAATLRGSYGSTVSTAWKFETNLGNSWCCGCKRSEGDVELEAEIMDFMAKSEKPTMFPTKYELMKAGRMDLVESIKKKGGWYSLGWDEENVGDNVEDAVDLDIEEFQRRVESSKGTTSLREHYHDSFSGHDKEDGFSSEVNSNSGNLDSMNLAASASLDGSLEMSADEDTGIEGILSRLEKQRNSDFGINLEKNGYKVNAQRKDERDDKRFKTSLGVARNDLGENGRIQTNFHPKVISSASSGNITPNSEPETWQTWSNRRAGSRHTEFEAAEISFSNNQAETDKEADCVGTSATTEEYADAWDKRIENNHNQIRARLQHLQSELDTTLCSIRSKRKEHISEEVTKSSSVLHNLSDAWEFQENEFMSAQGRLRSIRAKLAVLEGKMALAINDAQKIVEMKQNRIDGARKALQLLQTTCIVWTSPASEVLLAGSFDGWTTQRKMEKSRTGIFSVSLKLYPGKYEIKFIVDGIWRIDPLRPIVNNNGYENNLLIVT